MSPNFKNFKALHESQQLFILPNAWDAASATTFQQLDYPAIATSSYAVAGALGYEDGEGMPFEEYLFVIRRILKSIQLPLSVDMEMGFGKSDEEVLANALTLARLGVVGINIEDSVFDESGRVLKDAASFARRLAFLKKRLTENGADLFINVRCDTYLLGIKDARQETRTRILLYAEAGADGLFLPCIKEEVDIVDALAHTNLPLNVMWIPGLPTPEILQTLGVRRLSMGAHLYLENISHLKQLAQSFIHYKK